MFNSFRKIQNFDHLRSTRWNWLSIRWGFWLLSLRVLPIILIILFKWLLIILQSVKIKSKLFDAFISSSKWKHWNLSFYLRNWQFWHWKIEFRFILDFLLFILNHFESGNVLLVWNRSEQWKVRLLILLVVFFKLIQWGFWNQELKDVYCFISSNNFFCWRCIRIFLF